MLMLLMMEKCNPEGFTEKDISECLHISIVLKPPRIINSE